MPPSITATLQKALHVLEGEKQRIDRQIAAIRSALDSSPDRAKRVTRGASARPKPKRPQMSAAARRAVSQRMKAYWAKRKAVKSKANA